jgi:hypothetical protein
VPLSSSKPGVASVPATVTVPAGQTSATFAIQTTAVRVDTPAGITATSGGVTRSTTVYALSPDRECLDGTTEVSGPGVPLGARAFASFDDASTNADCGQNELYEGDVIVGAGSTGLPVGAPVTLQFSARYHGTTMTSPPIGAGSALADGTSTYEILDRTATTGTDGAAEVVNFRASYTLHQSAFGVNVNKQSRVDVSSNVGEPLGVQTSDEATTPDPVIWDVDTGTVSATFTTTVGARLSLRGRSSAVTVASGPGATAMADFDETFLASTTPAAGFEGIELAYDALTGVHGVVTATDGQPLAGITVMAFAATDTWFPSATATTAADGSYEIPGLGDGQYRLFFRGAGDRVAEWYDDSPTRAGATPVTVTGGDVVGGIDASLAVASTISGIVTGDGGEPLAGITVMAFAATDTWFPSATATTAADGSYEITGLAAGSYRLLFTGPFVTAEWYDDSPTRDGAAPVTVTPGATAVVAAAVLATV